MSLFIEIQEVMSYPLIIINSEETIWEAFELMKEKLIHKLPAKENDKIVIIIITTDTAKLSDAGSDSEMHKIRDQILLIMKR